MIALENAGKAFRDRKGRIRWIYRNTTAVFPDRKNHAVLSPRGEGKTTLINTLCANDTLSEGRIVRSGGVSYPVGFRGNISSKMSGKQNLRFLTDVYGRNFAEALDFCLAFSEIGRSMDAPLNKCTNEVRGRFCTSALLSVGFTHILIDDAIEGGDAKFRRKTRQYLADNADRLTLLIATSDPDAASALCQSASVLHGGVLKEYPDMSSAVEAFHEINKLYV